VLHSLVGSSTYFDSIPYRLAIQTTRLLYRNYQEDLSTTRQTPHSYHFERSFLLCESLRKVHTDSLEKKYNMATTSLPVLLPATAIPQLGSTSHLEWWPKKYRSAPQPPPQDDARNQEIELANARQMLDGKVIKKTRPRRTVDYNGEMGRWTLVYSFAEYSS